MTFKQAFFRIYDRKIASGEITFSRIGLAKDDFIKLCSEEGYELDNETIERLAITMKLTAEEKQSLIDSKAE